MLVLSDRLTGAPIMSLQTGSPIAKVDQLIIDPRQLKIVALYCSGPLVNFHPAVLLYEDIREFSQIGLIVNDSDAISPLDDLVRLKQIIDFGFELIGLDVVDDHKNKLGKVGNFGFETKSFMIEQLSVNRPLLKSFASGQLLVTRQQIIEINNERVVVKSPTIKVEAPTQAARFENPFKKSAPQPETSQVDS